ncbi:MAG: prepilin peptidase [Gimesia sp.]
MPLILANTISMNLWVLELFTASWCFIMGSVIGSFLNVVIYRMPLGLNISKPKSRCPVCEIPIRTRDNLPILGWILLRGKCRDCQSSISMRYPIVEFIVGCFFLLMYLTLVHSGGQYLPYRIPNKFWGVYQIMEGRTWDLVALDLYYSYLFIIVLAAAYIQFDRQIIPRRLLIWCFAIGIVSGLMIPELHPVPALISVEADSSAAMSIDSILTNTRYHGSLNWKFESRTLISLCWGLFYGGVAGILFSWPTLYQSDKSHQSKKTQSLFQPGTTYLLMLIGLYLGWQQVVSVCFLASLFLASFMIATRNKAPNSLQLPASAFLAAALALQLLLGMYLTILPGDVGYSIYLMLTAGQILAIPLLVGIAQYIVQNKDFQHNTQDPIPLDETSTITF